MTKVVGEAVRDIAEYEKIFIWVLQLSVKETSKKDDRE